MSLEERASRIDELFSAASQCCECERISRFVMACVVPKFEGGMLQEAWQEYRQHRDPLNPPPSPNGVVSPTGESVFNYNKLVRRFYSVVHACGLTNLIDSWCVPVYVRYKGGFDSPPNPGPFASEIRHIDAWAGEQPRGCRASIVLDGDAERNYVKLFDPPNDFDELWMFPYNSYASGEKIADRFTPLPKHHKLGYLYIADMCVLHQTVREPGCGSRVSVDVSFLQKGAGPLNVPATSPSQRIHKMRMSNEMLAKCGSEFIFDFTLDYSWEIKLL